MQAKGSSLAARFSGRWEQCLDRDAQGRVFLDFDPYCFQIVLTYLRARWMDNTLGRITPSPSMTGEKEYKYQGLIKYLGLEDYMGYSQARFATHHSHILLSQDALIASIKPGYDTEGRRDVLGKLPMLAGETYHYKLRIRELSKTSHSLEQGPCSSGVVDGTLGCHCLASPLRPGLLSCQQQTLRVVSAAKTTFTMHGRCWILCYLRRSSQ